MKMHSHQTERRSPTGLHLRQLPISPPRNDGTEDEQPRSPAGRGSPSSAGAKGDGPVVGPGCGCSVAGGYGVRVDLSAVFADERRACWMWAEPRRPVRWLAARLDARLHLPRPLARLALLAPLGLLHPHDPLALLRPGDTIRVIPLQCKLFRENSCCSAKGGVDECSLASIRDPCQDQASQTSLNGNYEDIDVDESLCWTKDKACNTPEVRKARNSRDERVGCKIEERKPCKCKARKGFNTREERRAGNVREGRTPAYCACTLSLSPEERAAAGAGAETAPESPLRAMKQCALALLDRLEHSVHSAPPSPEPPHSPAPPPPPRAPSRDRSRSPAPRARSRSADEPDAGSARADAEDAGAGAGAGGGGGRARRRRVRRRPRRPDPHTPTTPHDTAHQVDTLPASASASRDSSVVRNASAESRSRALAPRRVHALPLPAAAAV